MSAPELASSPNLEETGVNKGNQTESFEGESLLALLEPCPSSVTYFPQEAQSGQAGYSSPPSTLKLEDVTPRSWQNAPNSKCYASFGDRGTTATVGAFGQLLQFSDFLGVGSSGMFSVDHKGVDEPYQVTRRAWELHHRIRNQSHFHDSFYTDAPYGLRFEGADLEPSVEPQLTWINWRWPRHEYSQGSFSNFPGLKLTIQWSIHEKTVLQRCLLEHDGDGEFPAYLQFGKPLAISDLDHLDPHCKFNEGAESRFGAWPETKGHTFVYVREFPTTKDESSCAESSCVTPLDMECASHDQSPSDDDAEEETSARKVQDHHFQDPRSEKPHGVSVACSVAINGKFQSFVDGRLPETWPLGLKGLLPGKSDGQPHTFEIITAYKMSIVSRREISWKDLIDPRHIDIMKAIQTVADQKTAQSFAPHGSTLLRGTLCTPVGTPGISSSLKIPGFPKDHLSFAVRRNLEHILSVCAVEVPTTAGDTAETSHLPEALKCVDAVALTCGDIAGHKIVWSASFFAFRLLIDFYKAHDASDGSRDHDLLHRIKTVCLGHLKWLHLVHSQKQSQGFGANYWVTGKPMAKLDKSESRMAEASLLDTGFQILKAASCMELWDNDELAAGVGSELMSDWAPAWLISMEASDKRKKYAWPQAEKEGVNSFRLDEHVWIWQVLKSLEMEGHRAWKAMPEKCRRFKLPHPADREDWGAEMERLRNIFSSEIVRKEISKRFTTENTVLRKRMLATTRSIRGSRFMLHARDTALLYEDPFDFLGKDGSFRDLWKATVQSQAYHTEEQNSNLEKTLRYALYLMLGTRQLTIDNTPPDELVRTATTILIRTSSPNGIFPGRMEASTKDPANPSETGEEYLESYYHASFEIPYILYIHEKRVAEAYERLEPVVSSRRNSDSMLRAKAAREGLRPPHAQLNLCLAQGDAEQRQMLLRLSNFILSRPTVADPNTNQMSLGVRRILTKSVPFDKLVDSSNIVRLDDEWLYKYPDFLSRGDTLKLASDRDGLADMKGVLGLSKASAGLQVDDFDETIEKNLRYCIVDVQSSKRVSRKPKEHALEYNTKLDHLQETLRMPRTAENSKKRLLHFQMISSQAALHCFATTEKSERPNLKDFFERHSHCAKHPIDNCSMIQNSWESEFHLSYYKLVPKSLYSWNGIIAKSEIDVFPGSSELWIVRVAAGFRFKGDFFDRHWTCYLLDSSQNGRITNPNLLKRKEYCQRKVLEQRFFADILKSLNDNVGEILKEVKKSLGLQLGTFTTSIHTTNEYLSWSELWQGFEPLLQKLDDDLASTQGVVKQWDAREDERGKEKPRWTPGDEEKYRAAITRMRRQVRRQMSQLQRHYEATNSLQVLCSNRLDKAREDLSFRSDQNIAMFTYVTVVFLPLGFAASILSMNGPPDKSLTITVVIASAVALAATIVALMNAKALGSVAESAADKFEKFTLKVRKSSAMICDSEELGDKNRDKAQTSSTGHSKTKTLRGPPPSYLIFWAGFIFIEVPARTITSACRALGWSQDAGKVQSGSKDTEHVSASIRQLQNGQAPPGLRNTNNNSHPVSSHCHDGPATNTAQPSELPADDVYKDNNKLVRVIVGFFTLPFFVGTWMIQILFLNAWDALALLGELIMVLARSYLFTEFESDSRILSNLTQPSEYLRPMSMLKKSLRPDDEHMSKGGLKKSEATTEVPSSASHGHNSP